jgi:hypothetical protein
MTGVAPGALIIRRQKVAATMEEVAAAVAVAATGGDMSAAVSVTVASEWRPS